VWRIPTLRRGNKPSWSEFRDIQRAILKSHAPGLINASLNDFADDVAIETGIVGTTRNENAE